MSTQEKWIAPILIEIADHSMIDGILFDDRMLCMFAMCIPKGVEEVKPWPMACRPLE